MDLFDKLPTNLPLGNLTTHTQSSTSLRGDSLIRCTLLQGIVALPLLSIVHLNQLGCPVRPLGLHCALDAFVDFVTIEIVCLHFYFSAYFLFSSLIYFIIYLCL